MRRVLVLLVTVATMLAIPVAANAADVDDYTGIWTGVDGDGSRMILFITDAGGGTVNLTLRDNGGTFCQGPTRPSGVPLVPLVATGTGTIVNGDLVVPSYAIVCRNGVSGPSIQVTYVLGPDGTTMDDGFAEGWDLRVSFG